jgi:hypothetical protein
VPAVIGLLSKSWGCNTIAKVCAAPSAGNDAYVGELMEAITPLMKMLSAFATFSPIVWLIESTPRTCAPVNVPPFGAASYVVMTKSSFPGGTGTRTLHVLGKPVWPPQALEPDETSVALVAITVVCCVSLCR